MVTLYVYIYLYTHAYKYIHLINFLQPLRMHLLSSSNVCANLLYIYIYKYIYIAEMQKRKRPILCYSEFRTLYIEHHMVVKTAPSM